MQYRQWETCNFMHVHLILMIGCERPKSFSVFAFEQNVFLVQFHVAVVPECCRKGWVLVGIEHNPEYLKIVGERSSRGRGHVRPFGVGYRRIGTLEQKVVRLT